MNKSLNLAKAAYNARIGPVLRRFLLDFIRGVYNRNSMRVVVVGIFDGLRELIGSRSDNADSKPRLTGGAQLYAC